MDNVSKVSKAESISDLPPLEPLVRAESVQVSSSTFHQQIDNAVEDNSVCSDNNETDDDESDSDSEGEEDEEADLVAEKFECLLCENSDKDVNATISHMKSEHNFDMKKLKDHYYRMDQLAFVKMVNWLRSLKKSISKELRCILLEHNIVGLSDGLSADNQPSNPPPWNNDIWLQPQWVDDPFLCYDFEGLEGNHETANINDDQESSMKSCNVVEHEDVINQLQNTIHEMIQEKKVMQAVMSRLMAKSDSFSDAIGCDKKNRSRNKINVSEEEDSYYFESYDEIGIHAQMLKDLPRTGAYQRSICDNPCDIKGKAVMDLGCGTGILSMFCADTGARTVHAIDCSNIIYEAMENVIDNNLGRIIKCHKGRLETMTLDIEKVDVLVSEFMGYFLIYEGMLNSYLYARDHFLKPGGKMLPSSAEMIIVGICDEGRYRSEIESWDRMFGFKMESMKRRALKEPAIQEIDPNSVISEPIVVKSLDLHTCTTNDTVIKDTFHLQILSKGVLTAIGGYFSVGFQDGSQHKENLSTSPNHPPTHWKHCIFYLPQKLNVEQGDSIPVKMVCQPHKHNTRWLAIEITVRDVCSLYELR